MLLYITTVQRLQFPPVPVAVKGPHQSSPWILRKPNPLQTKEKHRENAFLSPVPRYPTEHCFIGTFPVLLRLSF